MALALRNEAARSIPTSTSPHGGRDAGAAHYLHGHHAHAAEGQSVDMQSEQSRSHAGRDKDDALLIVVMRDARFTLGPTGSRWTS